MILLKLRSTAKVKYKLISDPLHGRSDLLFKHSQMLSIYILLMGWLTCNRYHSFIEKLPFRSIGVVYRVCMPDFPISHTIDRVVSGGDYVK